MLGIGSKSLTCYEMVRIHNVKQQELFAQLEMNVIFDMDGTLSDDSWRRDRIVRKEDEKIDWDYYHKDGIHDLPIEEICSLYRSLAASGYGMIILTGRPIAYKSQTEQWLHMFDLPFHSIYMRPPQDYSSNERLKLRLLSEHGLLPNRVLSVYDDNIKTIELLRENGYLTFHVVMP
jgi:phosphoglycolate phosphatase-like HAD superfamily hydrolase